MSKIVQGFTFSTKFNPDHERHDTICQIIGRAGPDEVDGNSPMFTVRFGDGVELDAMSEQLHPWFPI